MIRRLDRISLARSPQKANPRPVAGGASQRKIAAHVRHTSAIGNTNYLVVPPLRDVVARPTLPLANEEGPMIKIIQDVQPFLGRGRIAGWGATVVVAYLLSSAAVAAADSPPTADVLNKLHHSNMKEVEMGKLAQKNGESKQVRSFGDTLVKDHGAADKKVMALAKDENIELKAEKHEDMDDMAKLTGKEFDAKFAKDMLEDHKKDVQEASDARDKTSDPKLKKLLTELVPTLKKHQSIAQKIVDRQNTTASK
jgi:putative membrane protein